MWPWGKWRKGHPNIELLSCYLDGQVSPREHQRIESHLAICQRCREVLADLQTVSQWMKALPPEEPSRPVRLEPIPTRPLQPRSLPPWAVSSAVAAALLLVVLVATDLSLGFQTRQGTPLPPPGAAATQPGQTPLILTPDIPKETGQPPAPPVAPAPPLPPTHQAVPRPLLAWGIAEGAVAGAILLFLTAIRLLSPRARRTP